MTAEHKLQSLQVPLDALALGRGYNTIQYNVLYFERVDT